MRTLYLIRHAKSSWDSVGLKDYQRPLNDRGMRDAPAMARFLVGKGVKPDLIVTSPAKRALTTALFFAEAFGIPEKDLLRNPDIYEAMPHTILSIVSALPDEARVVLLFGHNPTFTEIANRFSDDFIDNVATCGIVQIASEAPNWQAFYEGNARVTGLFFPKEVL